LKKHTKIYLAACGYSTCDIIVCEICGTVAVDIHHIDPRGIGGSKHKDNIENLIALCRDCHDNAEAGKITREELFEIVRLRICRLLQ